MKEINKKEGSSFKKYADALQKEAENFVNSRSRRNGRPADKAPRQASPY